MNIKILGVDIGIASIGWALIQTDEHIKGIGEIIDYGVRIFEKAENPKNGKPLALPRREARNARKNIKRRKQRVRQVKTLLSKYLNIRLEDMFSKNEYLPKFFDTDKDFLSPWQLRSEGLTRKLTSIEFARVLLHITKRRGYSDSNNDSDSKEEDSKIILETISTNRKKIKEGGFKTAGEMMFKSFFNKEISKGIYENVRNKGKEKDEISEQKRELYKRTIGRQELKEEIKLLFEVQRKLGNKDATEELEERFEEIAFYQRKLKSFESSVGRCEFYPEELRAAKSCCSAEKFINLSKIINTIKNIERRTGENYGERIKELIQETLDEAKRVKIGVSYKKFRKILGLEGTNFHFSDKNLDYTKKDAKETEKAIFIKFEKYHKLKDYLIDFSSEFDKLSGETLDRISGIIAFNKSPKDIKDRLKNLDISEGIKEKLINNKLNFSETLELSLKTIYKIIPFMELGKKYDEAVELAGLVRPLKKNNKQNFLPPLSETRFYNTLNPVVNRAISQYRKVINAVIKKHGKIHKLHIEFTREIGKSSEDRKKIEGEQRKNYELNQNAIKKCEEIDLEKNGKNILKMKLWLRQNEFCVYSGKKIDIKEHLKVPNELQIDHIYPLSRSLDDSQNNKVLVFTKQNDEKKNKTPYEWIGQDKQKWNELVKRVHTMKGLPRSVKRKILSPIFADKNTGSRGSFLTRNLNDTGYVNRLISQYTNDYLDFLPLETSEDVSLEAGSKGSKRHIQVISGSLTSMLRHYWGLGTKNRATHLHHAQDAIILAFITASSIKAFSDYLKAKEEGYYKKLKAEDKADQLKEGQDSRTKHFLREPIKDFRHKVEEAIDNIFVSKAPRRTVTGALHEQTIRERKEYFKAYGGEEGVEKALMLGKIRQSNGGIVDNGNMVRVDIFRSKISRKYYAVPIYTYDVAVGRLPNKAIVSGKDKMGIIKDWLEMDEKYEFCFSLFKDDLVEIQTKKMQKSAYVYYAHANSNGGKLEFKHHSGKIRGEEREIFKDFRLVTGIQGLKVFKKCVVSPLGEITEARFEPRKNVALKTTKKTSR